MQPVSKDVSAQMDSLRGASAVVVLLAHVNQILIAPTWSGLYLISGLAAQAAVMLFFALSGFLICRSIIGNTARHGRFSARSYAADRFNRIVPPLVLSLVVVAVLWAVAPMLFPSGSREFTPHAFNARPWFDVQLSAFLGSALFLNGFATATISANAPLWSLSFEVWYYVAAGIIATFSGRGVILAAGLMLLLGWRNIDFLLLSVVWFAGAVIALVHNAGLRLIWISRPTAVVCFVASMLLAFTYVTDNAQARSAQEIVGQPIRYYLVFVGLFLACMLYEVVLGTVKVPTFAAKSARYSYTLYIIHFPILLAVYGVLQPRIVGNLTTTIIVAGVSTLGCLALARSLAKLETWRPIPAIYPPAITA